MVSNVVMIVGLLCAGVAVVKAEASPRDFGPLIKREIKLRGSRKNFTPFYSNAFTPSHRRSECNKCITTTTEIIRRAVIAKEEGIDYFNSKPCTHFPSDRIMICNNVVNLIEKSSILNILDSRKYCAAIEYCPPKNPKPEVITVNDETSNESGRENPNYSAISSRPCRPGKTPPNTMDNPDNGSNSIKDYEGRTACRVCEELMRKLIDIFNNQSPESTLLSYICEGFSGAMRRTCYRILPHNSEKIIDMMLERKSPNAICTALKECTNRDYPYCRACQDYLYYPDENLIVYACSYLKWVDRPQCGLILEEKSEQMFELINKGEDDLRVCQDVKLCPPLIRPILPFLTSEFSSRGGYH